VYNTKPFLFTDGTKTEYVIGATVWQARNRAINEYGFNKKTIRLASKKKKRYRE